MRTYKQFVNDLKTIIDVDREPFHKLQADFLSQKTDKMLIVPRDFSLFGGFKALSGKHRHLENLENYPLESLNLPSAGPSARKEGLAESPHILFPNKRTVKQAPKVEVHHNKKDDSLPPPKLDK